MYSEIFKSEQNTLPLTERSIAYGDGVFTTAKIQHGAVVDMAKHLARLQMSTKRLAITYDDVGLAEQLSRIAKSFELAVLKIVVTAGEGGRGYSRVNSRSQKILITVHEFPMHYQTWSQQGINVGIANTQLGVNPTLAGIKHLNRLEQVLIRQELDAREEDDLLVTNCLNQVIEASAGNLFWLNENEKHWRTPLLTQSGVDGLMRQNILAKVPNIIIDEYLPEQLNNITAMFICNSVMGIIPVKTLNGKSLDVAKASHIQQAVAL